MEPIITEAHLPIKLSGPWSFNKLSNIPKEPLPEIGDNTVSGVVSLGIPKNEVTGDRMEHKVSKPPEAFKSSIEKINPIRDGNMFKTRVKPSFAPAVNSLKTLTPLKTPWKIIIIIIEGIIKLLI